MLLTVCKAVFSSTCTLTWPKTNKTKFLTNKTKVYNYSLVKILLPIAFFSILFKFSRLNISLLIVLLRGTLPLDLVLSTQVSSQLVNAPNPLPPAWAVMPVLLVVQRHFVFLHVAKSSEPRPACGTGVWRLPRVGGHVLW